LSRGTISFVIRMRLSTVSAWLRNPACANHQHGIDAHVDDAAVLGEAALRHEALHQAGGVFEREIAGYELPAVLVSDLRLASGFQASGKSANIRHSSGAVGEIPDFIHERRSWIRCDAC
jgi:hypothetical protein